MVSVPLCPHCYFGFAKLEFKREKSEFNLDCCLSIFEMAVLLPSVVGDDCDVIAEPLPVDTVAVVVAVVAIVVTVDGFVNVVVWLPGLSVRCKLAVKPIRDVVADCRDILNVLNLLSGSKTVFNNSSKYELSRFKCNAHNCINFTHELNIQLCILNFHELTASSVRIFMNETVKPSR